MPLVKVKPGLSHGYYSTVTKALAYHQAGDEFDASPAEVESFGDKFVLVVESESEPPLVKVNATRGAIRLAAEHGISLTLSDIVGTGRNGKIIQADVEALLNYKAETPFNGDAQR